MAIRVQVREIDDDEGRRLLRIIRRGAGSVVTWRRAQMALPSAQGIPVARIAEDPAARFTVGGLVFAPVFGPLPARVRQQVEGTELVRAEDDFGLPLLRDAGSAVRRRALSRP
ncbi:hypothetical protein OHB48_30160 [Streptomyces sp. NBC_00474]|nr:hypothetical protein [Streptomyces sp. NBC_00474]